jgi:5-methylcytosine-specific restriction enzyme subunit McrC
MHIIAPEFGSIDRRLLNKQAIARLRMIDKPGYRKTIFDWSDISRLRVQNYVGVIQVPGLIIEILPKTVPPAHVVVNPTSSAKADWRQAQKNLLFMLTVAGILPFKEKHLANLETTQMSLFEALIFVFAKQLMAELRRGIDRGYIGHEANLAVLRGKLLLPAHVRVNAMRHDRLFVSYDEFSVDTILNQIFKATCRRLLPLAKLAATEQLVRECIIELADVDDTEVTAESFDRMLINRNNERFEPLLQFCRLIMEGTPPQPGSGGSETFTLLFPMERLFEQFIGNLIRRHASQIGLSRNQVILQSAGMSQWLVETRLGHGRFRLTPDIMFLGSSGAISTIIDTKWKRLSPDLEDPSNGVLQADMYQLFAYATRFESIDNLLIYPAVPGVSGKDFRIRDKAIVRTIVSVSRRTSRQDDEIWLGSAR